MMEAANVHNKLILAVVQEDDYDTTVSELNQNGFFVTMLSSTGGFWKRRTSPLCWVWRRRVLRMRCLF